MKNLDAYWDFLIDNGIVSEDALRLVTNINGYSEDTLNDVLYCQTGNRSVEQYCAENEIELPDFVEESENISSLTNKILEGADLRGILKEATGEKVYKATLDRFGYTLVCIDKTKAACEKALIDAYVSAYKSRNDVDPDEDEIQEVKDDIVSDAIVLGTVEWE